MKLAIIDLDGVIANIELRIQKAQAAKEEFLEECRKNPHFMGKQASNLERNKQATDLFWRTAFDPANVPMDTLIDGANEALAAFTKAGYIIIFLTSRPESMRDATRQWLNKNGIAWFDEGLIMKAPAFQYTKTTVWKTGMVQTLASLYGATDVLIVDDEQSNIDEHLKYFSDVQTRYCYTSLQEAVEALSQS